VPIEGMTKVQEVRIAVSELSPSTVAHVTCHRHCYGRVKVLEALVAVSDLAHHAHIVGVSPHHLQFPSANIQTWICALTTIPCLMSG
jgi:hypothetical protein